MRSRAFFNQSLRSIAVVIFVSLSASCGKIKYSSSNDKAQYGLTNQGSAQFKSAFTIIARSCLGCHSAWGNYSETNFITAGLITNNDPTLSSIYFRLINNDSGIAGDMPLSGNVLTADEIAIIKAWVQIAN